MGLEKKAEARIFMDDDDLNPSAPGLSEKEKSFEQAEDRDPNDLNSHLKLGFEDVIAEPSSTHSFDKVWICSHALFELSKYLLYKLLTLLLAIPLAFLAGLVFALLSCLHIWILMPFVKSCLMVLPSVQTVWKTMTDSFIAPLFRSMGGCCSSVSIRLDKD
ncbi:caveolin-2 [Microcaecilia unicolor]|uniref:Caveolin n=1 Tax=Microcaecilia unicolor TaxID=1415580 RepID=A0A6P7YYJ0_9AMPH|nr:caveolin-2 [Microcaecilia unicolor]